MKIQFAGAQIQIVFFLLSISSSRRLRRSQVEISTTSWSGIWHKCKSCLYLETDHRPPLTARTYVVWERPTWHCHRVSWFIILSILEKIRLTASPSWRKNTQLGNWSRIEVGDCVSWLCWLKCQNENEVVETRAVADSWCKLSANCEKDPGISDVVQLHRNQQYECEVRIRTTIRQNTANGTNFRVSWCTL